MYFHYISNNQEIITDNSIVLIDAGAEYQYYAADITRTFPANGRFSAEQRAIYELYSLPTRCHQGHQTRRTLVLPAQGHCQNHYTRIGRSWYFKRQL